jgi:hypothetical protein
VADNIEDALIREVNDELREEQMMKLWSRYGGFVVGVAILVVAIVAGYQGWKQYTTSNSLKEGEQFYEAQQLADAGDINGALGALQKLAGDASTGYGVLADFQQAAIKANAGDLKAAAALYIKIADDNHSNPTVHGLATVLGTALEINTGGYDRGALTLRLEAISGNDQPYRFTARELLGLLDLAAGDTANARTMFTELSVDADAPQAMATRARSIAQSLGAETPNAQSQGTK